MEKTLMLDLEGVLYIDVLMRISDAKTNNRIVYNALMHPRNHAYAFMEYCTRAFDEIYINSWVPENIARKVLKMDFGLSDIGFWSPNFKKTIGYDTLADKLVVHVEDDWMEEEIEDMAMQGIHFIYVRPYHDYLLELDDKPVYVKDYDDELVRAQCMINRLLR